MPQRGKIIQQARRAFAGSRNGKNAGRIYASPTRHPTVGPVCGPAMPPRAAITAIVGTGRDLSLHVGGGTRAGIDHPNGRPQGAPYAPSSPIGNHPQTGGSRTAPTKPLPSPPGRRAHLPAFAPVGPSRECARIRREREVASMGFGKRLTAKARATRARRPRHNENDPVFDKIRQIHAFIPQIYAFFRQIQDPSEREKNIKSLKIKRLWESRGTGRGYFARPRRLPAPARIFAPSPRNERPAAYDANSTPNGRLASRPYEGESRPPSTNAARECVPYGEGGGFVGGAYMRPVRGSARAAGGRGSIRFAREPRWGGLPCRPTPSRSPGSF